MKNPKTQVTASIFSANVLEGTEERRHFTALFFFFFEGAGLWDVTVTPGGKQCWKSKENFCIVKQVVNLIMSLKLLFY